jgi:heme-degrading monooxygenase HmoA
MIARIWHGYTSLENATAYQNLLTSEIFPGIAAQHITGYKSIELLKRTLAQEVEFITIMWFSSMDAIIAFAGEDYEKAYVPDKAKVLLSHFDERSVHCHLKYALHY